MKGVFEMDSLHVHGITLGYGKSVVLRDIDLEVKPGEMVGIIGPNGCGKSTLIKGITRLIAFRSEQIFINGHNVAKMSRGDLARVVAVVPQNPVLPELFTAFEIVLMGRTPHLGRFGYEGEKDLAIARRAMEATQTIAFAERRVGELSGGERQRLTIARALTQQPKVLLLDEPTAHLDINHQLETLNLLRELCLEQGLVVVAATHDLNLVAQYCDRLIMLSQQRIYCQGTPHQVINPQNIKQVYGAEVCVYPHPVNDLPATLIVAGRKEISEKPRNL
ncbi:ABC transporter ATP-binding protein [Thermodesulfovibrionales bacterium]|nr:ABC transporter ATP-binding protein [Thermodesulfovibrionales bacterium]